MPDGHSALKRQTWFFGHFLRVFFFFNSFFKVTGLQLCSQWGTASEGENRENSLPAFCLVIKLNDGHLMFNLIGFFISLYKYEWV